MTSTQSFILHARILSIVLLLPCVCIAGQYHVCRVMDGDKLQIKKGNIKLPIRLVGIDAPETAKKKRESGQPFSQQSTKHLASLVLDRTVEVRAYGHDRYGRTLVEVFVDGINVNLEMVKAGMAEVYRGTPAKGHDVGPYVQAEKEAKSAGLGMWQLGAKYRSPREWRRTNGS